MEVERLEADASCHLKSIMKDDDFIMENNAFPMLLGCSPTQFSRETQHLHRHQRESPLRTMSK